MYSLITSKIKRIFYFLTISVWVFSNSTKFAAKRVKIYSPYVILNQTGIPLEFKSSTAFMGSDQIAAGQGGRSTDSVKEKEIILKL